MQLKVGATAASHVRQSAGWPSTVRRQAGVAKLGTTSADTHPVDTKQGALALQEVKDSIKQRLFVHTMQVDLGFAPSTRARIE